MDKDMRKLYESREDNKQFVPLQDSSGAPPTSINDILKTRDILAKDVVQQVLGKSSRERLIGDPHFYDPNIIQSAPRNFPNVKVMNEFMIEQWNSVTEPDDIVIVNGDFINFDHCTIEEGFEIIDRLDGHITLLLGNHDWPYEHIYREYGLDVIGYPILKDDFWIISHEPKFVSTAMPYANVFAHVHLNPMYKDVSPRSFCTSAERIGYKPILWEDVKAAVRNYGKGQ